MGAGWRLSSRALAGGEEVSPALCMGKSPSGQVVCIASFQDRGGQRGSRTMAEPGLILVTGAGGGIGGVGSKVVAFLLQRGLPVRAMAHHDNDRADALRALGADVVVGDLTRPGDVATALDSVQRMFFSMSLSPSYLEATATVATVARAVGNLDALVALSQMTVLQMDALSMSESHHQRMHWLSEQVLNWSRLPVVHVRPTLFLDNPLFMTVAARSIADSGTIRLPFGTWSHLPDRGERRRPGRLCRADRPRAGRWPGPRADRPQVAGHEWRRRRVRARSEQACFLRRHPTGGLVHASARSRQARTVRR